MMKKLEWNSLIMIVLLLFTQNLKGQSSKPKQLSPEDYDKWSTIVYDNLSPNGKWVNYTLKYDSGNDTLFVKHTTNQKQFSFPKGYGAIFSSDGKWLKVNQKNKVVLLNLQTHEQKTIDSVLKGNFFDKGQFIILSKKQSFRNDMIVIDLQNGTEYKIQDVQEYVISGDRKSVGYIRKDNSIAILWIDRKLKEKNLIGSTLKTRKNLVWNDMGNTITLLEEINNMNADTNHIIYFIQNVHGNEETISLNPSEIACLKGQRILNQPPFTPLLITTDNDKVLFYTKDTSHQVENKGVEIWNSLNKLEHKRNSLEGNPESRPKLNAWWPKQQKFLQITNDLHHSAYITPDGNRAIVYDPHQYEPQDEIMGPSDLWLTELNSGKSELVIEKQSCKVERIGVSPNSRYLNYFKDKNWWIFDMDSRKHYQITKGLLVEDTSEEKGGEPPSFGFAGWTEDSQNILIYTRFDIYSVSPDGQRRERLTNGEMNHMQFRVCGNLSGELRLINNYDFIEKHFNLNEGIILEVFDFKTKNSGYLKWTKEKGLENIAFNKTKIKKIKKASEEEAFIMIEESTTLSPQVLFKGPREKEKVIIKTNVHQKEYAWTKSQLISYQNAKGAPLEAVLLYPADYNPKKKYPMIVYVYEEQSNRLHNYYNPSFFNHVGFCPTNYTTDGYFILYPDIEYTLGRVGYSAADCVEAAVKETTETVEIDDKRIGIFGHSFGGYEAYFIITQSNLFAAAVAGAGYTDLVGHALSIDTEGRSQMWRYQTHQMRMGKSLYEDFKGYLENSPITYANRINTPVLSWTGMKDYRVDPQQSISFHMAMRSLKKKHILLLYPDEAHAIMKSEFQKDLTIKTKIWFDHYLKDAPLPTSLN